MSLTVDKSKKYDRQLRLWGDNGQFALENAHVCLIGCDSVGSEIIKNLILPGVGRITIIDDAVVTDDDISNNFFVMDDDIGKPRAEVCAKLLEELNDEVSVSFQDDSLESLITYKPEYFTDFTVVIACGQNNKELVGLDRLLYPDNIPLIVCYSLGMVASVRIIMQEHNVLDARPDNIKPDLRLDRPLKGLIELAESQNFDLMSRKDIAHCPWLIVLYKYLNIYLQKYESWPSTFKEKSILKDLIRADEAKYRKLRATGEENGLGDQLDSFEEACRAVSTAVVKTEIPHNVRTILEDTRCVNVSKESRPFWILMAALREFVNENAGALPIRGDIPDMTSDTQRYVALQRVYRNAADSDVTKLCQFVNRLCQTYQIEHCGELSFENVSRFAKNCRICVVLSTCSLERELKTSPSYSEDLVCPESDELSWYLALRTAAASFLTAERRLPGQQQHDSTMDAAHLHRLLNYDLSNSPRWKGISVRDEYLQEMCRYRGVQLHSVSAFLGGVVAQEAIKLITCQFIPITQPLLYNAITQSTHLIDL